MCDFVCGTMSQTKLLLVSYTLSDDLIDILGMIGKCLLPRQERQAEWKTVWVSK